MHAAVAEMKQLYEFDSTINDLRSYLMPKHNKKTRDADGQNISEDAAAITQQIVLMPRAMILACRRPWYSSMKQVLMHIYRDTQRRTQQSKNDAQRNRPTYYSKR